jgi:hypothetical protein
MPSPFPGMDPYLENPDIWPDVHLSMLVGIGEQLTRTLRPQYVGRIELTTFTVAPDDPAKEFYIPDEGVIRPREREPFSARHRQLKVRRPANGRVVTVIEIVSPWAKVAGSKGRDVLQEKRVTAVEAGMNWLEIDLLRTGDRTGELPECKLPPSAYRMYVNEKYPDGLRQHVWPVQLRDRLPVLSLPLGPGETDAPLDIQAVLDSAYERAGYDLDTDYSREPVPPLDTDDAAWADVLLRDKGLRN